MQSSGIWKTTIILVASITFSNLMVAQSVGINNNTPDASAVLDIKSNTKGILIPRTSSSSRIGIINPAKGLMVYDTTTSSFWFYNASAWKEITTGKDEWSLTGNTGTDTAVNFIGTSDNKPLRLNSIFWAGQLRSAESKLFYRRQRGQQEY
jgi:hypothetical protein